MSLINYFNKSLDNSFLGYIFKTVKMISCLMGSANIY